MKKITKRLTALLCVALTACLLFTTAASAWSYREDGYSYDSSIVSDNARPGDGWKKRGDNYYYYYKGEKLTGLRYIDDKAYYFDDYTGARLHDTWKYADGDWYYLNSYGAGRQVVLCKLRGQSALRPVGQIL